MSDDYLILNLSICDFQIAFCAETREKRDEAAVDGPTTQNILDMIKTGLENTFSEDNLKVIIKTCN